jgi:hypothetical protein
VLDGLERADRSAEGHSVLRVLGGCGVRRGRDADELGCPAHREPHPRTLEPITRSRAARDERSGRVVESHVGDWHRVHRAQRRHVDVLTAGVDREQRDLVVVECGGHDEGLCNRAVRHEGLRPPDHVSAFRRPRVHR